MLQVSLCDDGREAPGTRHRAKVLFVISGMQQLAWRERNFSTKLVPVGEWAAGVLRWLGRWVDVGAGQGRSAAHCGRM